MEDPFENPPENAPEEMNFEENETLEFTLPQFMLPDIGIRALKWGDDENFEEKEKKSAEKPAPPQNVASVDEMAKILEAQAVKTHENLPSPPQKPSPPLPQVKTVPLGESQKDTKTPPPGSGEKSVMIPPPPVDVATESKKEGKIVIGLTGTYVKGASPAKPGKSATNSEKIEKPATNKEVADLLDFLEESIDEYQKYIENIGRNGLSAVNLGYYRDDIQDILDLLKMELGDKLRPYWERIVKLDLALRAKAGLYVKEVGYENFKQYQIINDPPHIRWWWYLNRKVAPPIAEAKFWEIWKRI